MPDQLCFVQFVPSSQVKRLLTLIPSIQSSTTTVLGKEVSVTIPELFTTCSDTLPLIPIGLLNDPINQIGRALQKGLLNLKTDNDLSRNLNLVLKYQLELWSEKVQLKKLEWLSLVRFLVLLIRERPLRSDHLGTVQRLQPTPKYLNSLTIQTLKTLLLWHPREKTLVLACGRWKWIPQY